MKILDKINTSSDLKALNNSEINELCQEVREFLIEKVSKTGGHLASNLGAVELTVALHRSLNLETDKIVWDVGHQSYVHKIFTGRKNDFDNLRKMDGLSGFPKTSESETDSFNTGHSSTSLSAALGIATAKKLSGEEGVVVAVIGDGAMTGGMAYEALNHAGSLKIPMIIILNDNGIAISPSVGLLSTQLNRLRLTPGYFKFKRGLKKSTRKIPFIGKSVERGFSKFKNRIKRIVIKDGLFESLGIKYMGPADGHDVEEIELLLNEAKKSNELTVIHIQTKKGKGYIHAENSPDVFHGISKFDPKTGKPLEKESVTYSKIFGETLISLADENEKVVGITAAMPDGTAMTDFAKKYPDRFFDVGIAEQHAVTFSAGLATRGMVPVFGVYSTFLQRGYDQLLHDVALQNLHCIFAIDRAGIVGRDGETHQGVFDLSYLSPLPNFTIMAPSNGDELKKMLSLAVNEIKGPVAIRYPRGEATTGTDDEKIEIGKGRILKDGTDVAILAIGSSVDDALLASRILEGKGIRASVLDMRFLKPFDCDLAMRYIEKCKVIATVEENVSTGGLYSAVKEISNADILRFALPCEPIQMGSIEEVKKKYNLDGESIATAILKKFDK